MKCSSARETQKQKPRGKEKTPQARQRLRVAEKEKEDGEEKKGMHTPKYWHGSGERRGGGHQQGARDEGGEEEEERGTGFGEGSRRIEGDRRIVYSGTLVYQRQSSGLRVRQFFPEILSSCGSRPDCGSATATSVRASARTSGRSKVVPPWRLDPEACLGRATSVASSRRQ